MRSVPAEVAISMRSFWSAPGVVVVDFVDEGGGGRGSGYKKSKVDGYE